MPGDRMLKCAECGFENESQRIYCHNCGTKLDRSVLPPDMGRAEPPEKQAKRVIRLINPKPGFTGLVLFPLLKTLGWAVGVAGLVLVARPPASLPELPKKEDAIESRVLGVQIEEQQRSPQPVLLSVDETLANRYLAASIREKSGGFTGEEFALTGASVDFEPGCCRIWARCALFDYPLYFAAEFDFEAVDGKLSPKVVGAKLGGLPVHPLLAGYAVKGFAPVWDQLKREKRLVLDMQKVEIQHDKILLTTRPAAP